MHMKWVRALTVSGLFLAGCSKISVLQTNESESGAASHARRY